MAGLMLHDVLLAGLIFQVIDDFITILLRGKDSYSLFQVDGGLIPVIFFEEYKSRISQIYFIAHENS